MSQAKEGEYDLEYLGLDPLAYLSKVLPLAGTLLGAAMVAVAENKLLYVGLFVAFFGVNIIIAEVQKRVSYRQAMMVEPVRLVHNCGVAITAPLLLEPAVPVWLLLVTHVFGCSLLIKEQPLRIASYVALSVAASLSVYLGGTAMPGALAPGAVMIASGVLIQSFVVYLRTHIAAQLTGLMRSESKFSALYDDTRDMRVSVDPRDATIIDCNRPFYERVGYPSKAPLLNRRLLDYFGVSDSNESTAWFESLQRSGEILDAQVVLRVAGDVGLPCELDASSVRDADGALVYYDTVLRDRTERMKTQDALRRRSMFLANMSHEIRTPLNGVLGMTELLRESVTDTEGVRRLDVIRACGESLLAIINDILDFTKIEAGKLEVLKEPTDPVALAGEVRELFEPRAQAKGIALTASVSGELPPWLSLPATRVRQVLSNLVSNAIKFTQKGGVRVELTAAPAGERVTLTWRVVDDGVGISPAAQARLFQSFNQVRPEDGERLGGTGLGLAISRQLVELMGGEIGVESELGAGSTFWFTIEASPCEAPVKTRRRAAVKLPPMSVLVVDDVESNLEVACSFLRRVGIEPDTASTGRDALEMVAAGSYDVVLMDSHMPVMNGLEATREIIARMGPRAPRVIGLTASALASDIEKCTRAGMDAVVFKPLQIDALVEVLSEGAPAQAEEEASAPVDRTLDVDTLLEHLGGNRDLLLRLLGDLRDATPDYVLKIRQAVDRGDARDVQEAAHKFKGVLLNMRAHRAAQAVGAVEALGADGSLGEVERAWGELEEGVAQLVDAIEQSLATEIKRSPPPVARAG